MSSNSMSLREKLNVTQIEVKAPKNQYNSFGKYNFRNAAGILESLKPFMDKLHFYVLFNTELIEIGGKLWVKGTAKMCDAHTPEVIEATSYVEVASELKGMSPGQVSGATESYCKKYALCNLFAIDDSEDLDSERFSTVETKKKSPVVEEKKMSVKDASNFLVEGNKLGEIYRDNPMLFDEIKTNGNRDERTACAVIEEYVKAKGEKK